jgi:hypothetical protein
MCGCLQETLHETGLHAWVDEEQVPEYLLNLLLSPHLLRCIATATASLVIREQAQRTPPINSSSSGGSSGDSSSSSGGGSISSHSLSARRALRSNGIGRAAPAAPTPAASSGVSSSSHGRGVIARHIAYATELARKGRPRGHGLLQAMP